MAKRARIDALTHFTIGNAPGAFGLQIAAGTQPALDELRQGLFTHPPQYRQGQHAVRRRCVPPHQVGQQVKREIIVPGGVTAQAVGALQITALSGKRGEFFEHTIIKQ